MAAGRREVSIGFEGGGSLAVRLSEEEIKDLGRSLGKDGWHELAVEDGTVRLRLDKVVYVRVETREHRVGFG
jgi:hypothetical protein